MDTTLPLLGLLVVVTSAISGVLGMAGGMILMGAYGWVLPVATAMVLHGVTQAASNGSRALLLARHVRLSVLAPFAAGAAVAVAGFAAVDFVIPRGGLFLALGLVPFLAPILARVPAADVTRPGGAAACGLSVTGLHLVAGVSGPLLDAFFLRSALPAREVIATKAVTQVAGHLLKIVYFSGAAGAPAGELTRGAYAVAVGAALAGTWLGTRLLRRMDEKRFRSVTAWTLRAMGAVYLAKGAAELL